MPASFRLHPANALRRSDPAAMAALDSVYDSENNLRQENQSGNYDEYAYKNCPAAPLAVWRATPQRYQEPGDTCEEQRQRNAVVDISGITQPLDEAQQQGE